MQCDLRVDHRALGLAETRRMLRETLEWPTKYAAIFAQSPLRLRSGCVIGCSSVYPLCLTPNQSQAFTLRLPWLWEDVARLSSCEGMWLEFYQHQGPRASEQVYRRERKVG